MSKYYDRINHRLVFVEKKATPEFWDSHWDNEGVKSALSGEDKDDFVLAKTRRFLKGGRVLEGGCGAGGYVASLQRGGYIAFGVDSARDTVKKINEYAPELNVKVGDVRKLEFADSFFDGYWSLGVIEHFHEGYGEIVGEMNRVLRIGGFVFLTFPYMSPLRRLKAGIGAYPDSAGADLTRFYQFALDGSSVKKEFEAKCFRRVHSEHLDGLKGFKDEAPLLRAWLQSLYDYRGGNLAIIAFKGLLDFIFRGPAAHMELVVFQKVAESNKGAKPAAEAAP